MHAVGCKLIDKFITPLALIAGATLALESLPHLQQLPVWMSCMRL